MVMRSLTQNKKTSLKKGKNMKTKIEYFSITHPIDQFVDIETNSVQKVKSVRVYDNVKDDYYEIDDARIISAYCYFRLNCMDEYLLAEMDEFISGINKDWELTYVNLH